jgi:signal peptidase
MILSTLVVLAVIAPFAVFAIPQVVGADESYVVLSGSMEPALSPGDVVLVDATAPIAVGDVITYTRGGSDVPTTHRVVGTTPDGYETRGDANENVDAGAVPADAVIGRVGLVIPWIGHVILWANSPMGVITLIVIPLVLLGITELAAWARREPTPETPDTPVPESLDTPTPETPDATHPAEPSSEDAPTDGDIAGLEPAEVASVEPTDAPTETMAIAVVDLKLTLLAMGVLLAYAGWNVYREFTVVAAPSPISVAALTVGLLGLLFTGWVTVSAWRLSHAAGSTPTPPAVTTDGGADMEGYDD